ncbi:sensor domain-containing diguanylate cyclase [Gammaproteobacteria bacterium LSUCC0112]|nr:sensor domain-containing diguanylate cyclase [Gammaproteobacteria bacterium LSUCC0112]
MTINAANDSHQLLFWSAEFKDPAIEQAYQLHVQPDTVRFLRISLFVWAGLLLFFVPADLAFLALSEGFFVIAGLRVTHAALLVWLARQVSRRPDWASNGWPVTIIALLGYPMYLVYPSYDPELATVSLGVMMLMFLSMYVFIPNRLMLTNLIALVGIVGVVTGLVLLDVPVTGIVLTILTLCWPAMLGYVAAQRVNIGSRRSFVLLQQAASVNLILEQEISRRKELEEELNRQALIDPLTGLSNRRHYEMLFEREHDRCRRHDSALTLGMIDLDHFKRINDTYGHDFGDQVLKFMAEILQQPLRHSDILGRFGGEEFILILPDTDIAQAQAVAERMRLSLEQDAVIRNGNAVKVTATFALTQVRAEDADIQECIRRADQALYEGKRAGRNRVALADAA